MAARIAATDKLPPGLAQDTQAFRDTILGKFAKVITGELAGSTDQTAISEIMQVIALVQPFGLEDQSFRNLVSNVTGLKDHVVARLLRLLADGGVIFPRGSLYRLMPDLLGDYIIEQSCIDTSDRLNSLADRVFTEAPTGLLGNVLVNLGRLDWRKNGGDVGKSHLVDHLWRALQVEGGKNDPAFDAAAAAAYYNPRQAIEFVGRQITAGNIRDELSTILRNAAYHIDFVRPACELLWELGRDDTRELNRFPGHGIRALTELVSVEPDKPISFNSKVVEFGLALLSDRRAFEQAHTPFDFLKGILSGEGHTDSSDGHTLTLHGFEVNYDAVKHLRRQVIDAAIGFLADLSIRIASLAADFLEDSLRYPMGLFGHSVSDSTLEKYTVEFLDTLGRLRELVAGKALDPVVIVALAQAISWHANYAPRATRNKAREIMNALPTDLEFRALGALADGWGQIFLGRMTDGWQERINKWIADLVAALNERYPDPAALYTFVETSLERLIASGLNKANPATCYCTNSFLLDRIFHDTWSKSRSNGLMPI